MSKYFERTLASKPTFGDYVTLPMKCYGGPNEHFVHEVLSSPFVSNSWREVPIKAGYFEEQLHDTSETVVAVRTQGINPRDAHIFAVRLADVLPMKGDKWSWRESPLRSHIAELEAENETIISDYEERMDNLVNIGNETGRLLQAEIGYLNAQLGIKNLTTETLQLRIAELEAAQRWHVVKECNDVATPIDVALRKRIAKLEAVIDQLIEVSEKMFTAVIAADDSYDEGMRVWDKLVRDWKEG